MRDTKGEVSFSTIVATIGVILIAVGFAWLIATNWHQIPDVFKILILVVVTGASYGVGVFLSIKKYHKISHTLYVLGALLFTLSLFLIAQIFSLSLSLQQNAMILLLAWVGIVVMSYLFNSWPSLLIGLVQFLIWVTLQYFAFLELRRNSPHLAILMLTYLAVGVMFHGLYLLHRYSKHPFSGVFQWWSVFYILVFSYVLSFQSLLAFLWYVEISFSFSTVIFLLVLSVIALCVFLLSVLVARSVVKNTELLMYIGVVVLLVLVIFASQGVASKVGECRMKYCYDCKTDLECKQAAIGQCVWENSYCTEDNCYRYTNATACGAAALNCTWRSENGYEDCISQKEMKPDRFEEKNQFCSAFSSQRDQCQKQDTCAWNPGGYISSRTIPLDVWAIWIFDNVVFLILILLVIGYGTLHKSPAMVNLGIVFFSLEIFTRYIGFIMDYWGYTSLSILFIIGGIILLLGGLGIEKWRRRLIKKATK